MGPFFLVLTLLKLGSRGGKLESDLANIFKITPRYYKRNGYYNFQSNLEGLSPHTRVSFYPLPNIYPKTICSSFILLRAQYAVDLQQVTAELGVGEGLRKLLSGD